jgi:hypothetical protein
MNLIIFNIWKGQIYGKLRWKYRNHLKIWKFYQFYPRWFWESLKNKKDDYLWRESRATKQDGG